MKTKFTKKDLEKIRVRYDAKLEEYKLKTMDELREIWKLKLSSTDMNALKAAALYLTVTNYQKSKENDKNI